jgi:hypothetical protein
MHHLILLAVLLCPALATAANCTLPATLDQRQFTNLSDPLYAPDNPNAGRMVQLSFAATSTCWTSSAPTSASAAATATSAWPRISRKSR